MITLMMYINLILFLFALSGVIYAIVKIARKDMPLYCISILCAWISLALGRLYLFLVLLVDKPDPNNFNLSWFAFIASFVFLFGANYGCFDEKTSIAAKGNTKQKLIALSAPICILAVYFINLFEFGKHGTSLKVSYRIFCLVLTLLIMQTTYFNLKHLIIKTDKDSVLYRLKSFNFIMLVYSFLTMVEITAPIRESKVALIIIYSLIGITSLSVMPVLKRGDVKC